MASHNDLFSIGRNSAEHPQPSSPHSASRASPVSTPILPPPPQDSYWADTERRYPKTEPEPLEASLLPPIREPSRNYDESTPTDPSLDFGDLIPMYDTTARSPHARHSQLLDMPYPEWGAAPQHYSAFPRNGNKQQQPTLWPPPPDGAFPPPPPPGHWDSPVGAPLIPQLVQYPRYSPHSSASESPPPTYFPNPHHHVQQHQHHPYLPRAQPSTSRSNGGGGGAASTPSEGTTKKSCSHCHVTTTPLWRRDPSTQRPLCNACGLYLQQRNKLRPQELIDADNDDAEEEGPQISDADYTGPKCSHCLTRHTSVWRRSKTGAQVCNACGVYARLRGKERPLSLRRNKIKPRTKHSR
ncbi:hypothetical protein FB45DRAFT_939139 [Roridomyces roridus]|uniref:GATA-type domain-containing protein n=1 Tax=Roridomyces roridus TaxID=1738132 RepID=A0AAD7B8C8_9AGAR|nr:hypothetical protein FB45DRAFT_939139 [Roridomyces roridus]